MRQADVQTQLISGLRLSQQGDVNTYAAEQGNAAAIAQPKSEGYNVQLGPDGKSYTIGPKPGQSAATAQKEFSHTAQNTYDDTQNTFEQNYMTALQQIQPLPGETKAEYAQRIHDVAMGMTKDHKSASSFQPNPVYVKSNRDNATTGPDTVQPGDTENVQKQIAGDLAHKTGNNNQLYTIDKGTRTGTGSPGELDTNCCRAWSLPSNSRAAIGWSTRVRRPPSARAPPPLVAAPHRGEHRRTTPALHADSPHVMIDGVDCLHHQHVHPT